MNDMTALALRGEAQSYNEGAEDGFWAGYRAGCGDMTTHIMGFKGSEQNPYDKIPDEHQPLGHRYLPMDLTKENQYA